MRPAYAGLRRTARGANPVVCGRKHCSTCGRWRLLCDFALLHERTRNVCHACIRARQRAAYRRRTPEQIEARREYERIYAEAHRRMRGVPPRPFNYDPRNRRRRRTVIDRPERIFVDPGPVLAELRRATGDFVLVAPFARAAGVSERAIYRYRVGESRRMRIDAADKLAVALGIPLELLYPSGAA